MIRLKVLGIIGGMGSVAAAYTFKRLVELTPAKQDQEYIETVVHNNTKIPDRTEGILYGGESPFFELKRSVNLLDKANADYIILACMTSHYFIDELQKTSNAKLIDGINETAIFLRKNYPDIQKVGLIASTGAINSQIFQRKFEKYGVTTLVMDNSNQQKYFTDPIYESWGVKAGNITGKSKEILFEAVDILHNRGAEAIIGGCSELPLIFKSEKIHIPFIDTIDILVQSAISRCLEI